MLLLDKNSRKVLNYFKRTNTKQSWDTIALNVSLNKNMEENIKLIETSLKYLSEDNYIKPTNKVGTIYELTNKGNTYYKNLIFIYIYPIITSTISLIVSLLLK